jgi:FAD/FMN-containing dehydrogenase
MKHTFDNDCSDTLPPAGISRRRFLALSVLGTLSGTLSACLPGETGTATATPTLTRTPTPTQTPVPTRPPTLTEADWTALAKNLKGTLVRPSSPQYAVARQLFSPRFDNVRPAAIAYCASPTDVQRCLDFARRFRLPLAPRAGGHSYAGYSTTQGLLLDVTRMNAVTVHTDTNTATIGAGARLIDVYAALAQYGLALPAGSCATVGIAGLALGGGVGVLGRKFGLTCDNLLSAQVVLADGRMILCDANHDADLFWALRGGGGGNFGVVTSFTFRVHPVAAISLFTFGWPWSSAAEVVAAWQAWAPSAPDELWSNCVLGTTPDRNGPIIRVNGVYVGNVAALNSQLQKLTGALAVAPTSNYVTGATLLGTMLYEAGCSGKSVSECHLPTQNPQGQLSRELASVKSDYFTRPLPREAITTLVNAIAQRQSSPSPGGGIGLDAFGGALNRVRPDATAFVHRNALFSAQYLASWNAQDPPSIVEANRTWLNTTWERMRPYASGASYQNYVDPDLTGWQHAYYGNNLPRLQRVKAHYDPDNFFHFAQSIPPPGSRR